MKVIKMLIIVAIVFLFATGTSWGEDIKAETAADLKAVRMQVAVDLQLLQLEGQGIIDKINKLRDEAQKLAPKIDKLKEEFMDLTDKINKAGN